ncbi:MAG TPA: nitrate/nitrite transporter NrtS [Allosphingosinicella sp.]
MTRREALRRTFAWPAVRRSLWVAVIVGSILNLINQGEALLGDGQLVVWKLLLTYAVPFAVASYGSYAALRSG